MVETPRLGIDNRQKTAVDFAEVIEDKMVRMAVKLPFNPQ